VRLDGAARLNQSDIVFIFGLGGRYPRDYTVIDGSEITRARGIDDPLVVESPPCFRVIIPAAIPGRDSTARYSAMRGPTAVWRAMAQGGPHEEAMALSTLPPVIMTAAVKRAPVTAVLTGWLSMLRRR
jgi:hypothetical protein